MPSFNARLIIIFGCCLLLVGIAVTTAAEDCPALVQSALKTIDDACSDTGRNQACYGNIALSAQPQAGIDTLNFHQKGDRVDLLDVKSLKLSAMDAASNTWGVAMLKVQANLPDTLPGQNVTFLLFGDVSLDNAQTPTTTPASRKTVFGPMQAFYFRSGLNDAPCEQAPSSGILIQSPAHTQKTQLRINEVDITLGSTIYVQLSSATEMIVSVVEGQATLTAFGKTVVAPAGTRVRVAVDATTLAASAEPSDAEAYIAADLASLPLQHLPLLVTVAPALDVHALATLAASQPTATPSAVGTPSPTPTPSGLSSDLPISGAWHSSMTISDCGSFTTQSFDQPDVRFTFEQGGTALRADWAPGDAPAMSYNRVAPGVYVWSGQYGTETLYVHSSKDVTRHWVEIGDNCTWEDSVTYFGPGPSPTPAS